MKPVRIQRSRRKGARLVSPNGLPVVCVTRPGRWGNPYIAENIRRALSSDSYDFSGVRGSPLTWEMHYGFGFNSVKKETEGVLYPKMCSFIAVKLFRELVTKLREKAPEKFEAWIAPLRGKNLACWCKPGDACHADVLLELANEPASASAAEVSNG